MEDPLRVMSLASLEAISKYAVRDCSKQVLMRIIVDFVELLIGKSMKMGAGEMSRCCWLWFC